MKQFDIKKEYDFYGVKIYLAKERNNLSRHKFVFVDLASIADKTGLSVQRLMSVAEYDISTIDAIGLLFLPGGQRVKAIRANKVPSLFQLLNVSTNGKNEMVKSAKLIVAHAVQLAPKEEGELFA